MGKSFAMNYLFLPFFCHFFVVFFPFFAVFGALLGLFLRSFILSSRDESSGSQVFGERVGTVGQLGQLKISIIQNTRMAKYLYN